VPASCCILEPNTPVGIYRPADDRCEVNPTTSNSYLYKVRLFIFKIGVSSPQISVSDPVSSTVFSVLVEYSTYLFEYFFHSDYSFVAELPLLCSAFRYNNSHIPFVPFNILWFSGLLQQVHKLRSREPQHCHRDSGGHRRRTTTRHHIRLLRLQGEQIKG
jgi:hypothetical protein